MVGTQCFATNSVWRASGSVAMPPNKPLGQNLYERTGPEVSLDAARTAVDAPDSELCDVADRVDGSDVGCHPWYYVL